MIKEEKLYGTVCGGSLNVRKAPSMDAEIVKVLKENDKVEIKEVGSSWHKVSKGYVMAQFIKLDK